MGVVVLVADAMAVFGAVYVVYGVVDIWMLDVAVDDAVVMVVGTPVDGVV